MSGLCACFFPLYHESSIFSAPGMPRQASALPISPVTLERTVLSGPAFRPRHEPSLLGGSPGGSSRKDLEAQLLSSRRKRCRSLCVILQMQGAAGLRNGSPRDPVQRILWAVPGTDHERKSRIRGYPFGIRGTGDLTRRLETGCFRASEGACAPSGNVRGCFSGSAESGCLCQGEKLKN